MKHYTYHEQVGGLRFTANQKDSGGGFLISGFTDIHDASVTLTTYGGADLNFHAFSRQQLEALSRVALVAAKTADPEPEPDGPEEVSC